MILILDDEPTISEAVKALLSAHGYEVEVCSTCEEALELLQSKTPELILSDVNMPSKSGVEFLQEIREMGLVSNTPVIFISGRARQEDRNAGFEAGAVEYLEKPVDPMLLVEKVKQHLNRAA